MVIFMLNTMFKDFDVWYDDALTDGKPFIFACRDREACDGERWVLSSLSKTEVKKIIEYLSAYIKE